MTVNRTQGLVNGFFALVWVCLVVIVGAAPEIFDQPLNLPSGNHLLGDAAFVLAVSVFIVVLSVGVIRCWRWAFWLIMIAFPAGVLRVPSTVPELSGVLPADSPSWYVVLQGCLGLIQFVPGLAMLLGLRRAGVWGSV